MNKGGQNTVCHKMTSHKHRRFVYVLSPNKSNRYVRENMETAYKEIRSQRRPVFYMFLYVVKGIVCTRSPCCVTNRGPSEINPQPRYNGVTNTEEKKSSSTPGKNDVHLM